MRGAVGPGWELRQVDRDGPFMLESRPMSHRFYAFFYFFSRLAAEGTG
jgi:hypothetical protein